MSATYTVTIDTARHGEVTVTARDVASPTHGDITEWTLVDADGNPVSITDLSPHEDAALARELRAAGLPSAQHVV